MEVAHSAARKTSLVNSLCLRYGSAMLLDLVFAILSMVALGVVRQFAAIAVHEQKRRMLAVCYGMAGAVLILFGGFLLLEVWLLEQSYRPGRVRLFVCLVLILGGGSIVLRSSQLAASRFARQRDR